jgi:hypothetical protein
MARDCHGLQSRIQHRFEYHQQLDSCGSEFLNQQRTNLFSDSADEFSAILSPSQTVILQPQIHSGELQIRRCFTPFRQLPRMSGKSFQFANIRAIRVTVPDLVTGRYIQKQKSRNLSIPALQFY